ncbi:MAG: LPXTG cell wall anchor domain-containing protein [Oscillospiraceae bacterium]|nr:LPXTG cell wall anchor domain-containing protein [Oscillospiraceae bacterium]
MKRAVKFLTFVFAVVMTAALISNPAVKVSADDMSNTSWKQTLKDFLVKSFPSLFDAATINKNQEVLNNWINDWGKDANGYTDYAVNTYVPKPGDIPVDALGGWDGLNPYYPLLLPMQCHFYDLDNDGIPEVVITYPTSVAEGHHDYVYKLNSSTNKYEQIYSTGNSLDFYTNAQDKLVAVEYMYMTIYGIHFADIKDGGFVYGDYIDSKGSDTISGVNGESTVTKKYGDINGAIWDEVWTEINTLKPYPEFDCSDVINSIQGDIPSPKTGSANAVVFAGLAVIGAAFILAVSKNKKRFKI